ncbi:recombination protein RecT [Pseudoduganella lurida]|uniref:Recombination protein RecT n=1 Tax=Pseudoduganella lurida TaxID=1036180 RepID=A0A562RK96_9BURK|nr:recombination protein RecT [Pseudoduganella lurida]TWI69024.1 recombination protein RecT [Pseudoduganella lurida]
MSTSQLKAITTGQPAKAEKPKDLAQLMASPAVQSQLKVALPRHMTAERMARIATTEMRKIPKLAQCDPMSFLGAVIQCAQLGLEPGNALGHAYILPFDKRQKVGGRWETVGTEAQVIIGYRGMIDLARRSGQIISIEARGVYEGDQFDCELGLDSKLTHTPDWQNPNRTQPDKLRFVYAVAKLKDGGVQFDVMSRAEVDGIRARSKSADNGPWVTDYAAMALKSVVRRLFKFLPVSIEMQQAVGLDEQADAGVSQQNSAVIDGNFAEVEPPQELGHDAAPPADQAGTGADFAVDYDTMFSRISQCADLDVLDILVDELRTAPPSTERTKLEALATERRAALEGGQ